MLKYQLLPPLSEDEFASLKANIEARGVLVPVEYDERWRGAGRAPPRPRLWRAGHH
jgi:hypothetical protein